MDYLYSGENICDQVSLLPIYEWTRALAIVRLSIIMTDQIWKNTIEIVVNSKIAKIS